MSDDGSPKPPLFLQNAALQVLYDKTSFQRSFTYQTLTAAGKNGHIVTLQKVKWRYVIFIRGRLCLQSLAERCAMSSLLQGKQFRESSGEKDRRLCIFHSDLQLLWAPGTWGARSRAWIVLIGRPAHVSEVKGWTHYSITRLGGFLHRLLACDLTTLVKCLQLRELCLLLWRLTTLAVMLSSCLQYGCLQVTFSPEHERRLWIINTLVASMGSIWQKKRKRLTDYWWLITWWRQIALIV